MSSVAELEKLRVVDLKERLAKLNLPTTGLKKALVERLYEALAEKGAAKGDNDEPAAAIKPAEEQAAVEAPKEALALSDGEGPNQQSSDAAQPSAPVPSDEPKPKRSSHKGRAAQQTDEQAADTAADSKPPQQQQDGGASPSSKAALAANSPPPQPPVALADAAAPPANLDEGAEIEEAPTAAAATERTGKDKAVHPAAAAAPVHEAEENEPETAADLLGAGGADMMLDYEAEDEEPVEPPKETAKSSPEAAPASKQQEQEQPLAEQQAQDQGLVLKEEGRHSPAAEQAVGGRKRRHEPISFNKEVKRKSSSGTPAAAHHASDSPPPAAGDDATLGDAGTVGNPAGATEGECTEAAVAPSARPAAPDKKGSGAEGAAAGGKGKAGGAEGAGGSSQKRKHSPIPAFIPRTSSRGVGGGPPAVKRQPSREGSGAAASGNGDPGLMRVGSSRQDPGPAVDREKAVAAAEVAGPAPDHATTAILVQNLARPFNEPQQMELLGQAGVVTGLWTARIKTHCYVVYEDKQQAWATLKALQGISWPKGNKKTLVVKFVPEEVAKEAIRTQVDPVTTSAHAGAAGSAGVRAAAAAAAGANRVAGPGGLAVAARASGSKASAAPAAPAAPGQASKPSVLDRLGDRVQANDSREDQPIVEQRGQQEDTATAAAVVREEEQGKGRNLQQQEVRGGPPAKASGMLTLDELFRSTKVAKPMLYWLPLSEEEVAAKRARRAALEGGPGGVKEPVGSAVQEGLPTGHTNRF